MYKRTSVRLTGDFLSEITKVRDFATTYSKCCEKNTSTNNPISSQTFKK